MSDTLTPSPVLILHNIRSVYNVGSLFRTADAVGIEKMYLSGYTPTPLDRFGRPRKDLHKTALGAEESVAWEHTKSGTDLIRRLKREGYYLVAIELADDAIDYRDVIVPNDLPVAFILGNEVRGVSKQIRSLCNVTAQIPMRGEKESLNVSVAGGVALFGILGR